MARQEETMMGRRVKRWVVVEDIPKGEKRYRTVRVACVACGEEAEVVAGNIRKGTVKDCTCGKMPVKILPVWAGIACNARYDHCESNRAGRCCHWCSEQCDNKCMNSPDRCGSFYSGKTELEKFLEEKRR